MFNPDYVFEEEKERYIWYLRSNYINNYAINKLLRVYEIERYIIPMTLYRKEEEKLN